MSLMEQIANDFKTAMKEQNKFFLVCFVCLRVLYN